MKLEREDVVVDRSVVTRVDIEVYPTFQCDSGATGRITEVSPELVRVLMDEHIPGLEEWGNHIECYQEFDRTDNFDAIDAFLAWFDGEDVKG